MKHRVWSEKDSSKSSLFHIYLQWTIFLIYYPLNDLKPSICCVPLHYLLFPSHPFLTSTVFVLCLSFSVPHINTTHHDLELHNEESHKWFSKCDADHKKDFMLCIWILFLLFKLSPALQQTPWLLLCLPRFFSRNTQKMALLDYNWWWEWDLTFIYPHFHLSPPYLLLHTLDFVTLFNFICWTANIH